MSRRRYVTPAPADPTCSRHLRPEPCALCARDELPRLVARLEQAVTAGRPTVALGSTGGGTPSWELVNVAALALLQDIGQAGWRLTDHQVLAFCHRAKVILGDEFAAYTPLVRVTDDEKERGKPIQCPRSVVHGTAAAQVSDPSTERCSGVLQVHRDSDPGSADYTKPTVVRCSHKSTHEWQRKAGGFLRLRIELDDVGHVHFTIDDLVAS